MKTHFLFPNKFKTIGWFMFVPSLITFSVTSIFNIDIDTYLNLKVFAVYADSIGEKPGFFKRDHG